MKRISLFAVIADSILAALCAFALFFTAVRFYTKSPAIGLTLGIAAFVIFGALAFLRLSSKRGKAAAFGKNQRRRQALRAYLCTLATKEAKELLSGAVGGNICGQGVESDGKIYVARFEPSALTPNEMYEALAFDSSLKKVVACNEATDEAIAFAKRAGADIMTADEIFDKLEATGTLPESHLKDDAKPAFKDRLKGAIRRANAGRLFWCGLWLTAFSYFTFFPVYYIVAGGLMLIFAAVCLVFGRRD